MGCISSTEAIAKKQPRLIQVPPETPQAHPDGSKSVTLPVIGSEGIMSKKVHGTSITPVQDNLRWDCDFKTADRICNYNRRYGRFCFPWNVAIHSFIPHYSFMREIFTLTTQLNSLDFSRGKNHFSRT